MTNSEESCCLIPIVLTVVAIITIICLAGCDDKKSDADHNHVYSSDNSVNTEPQTPSTDVSTIVPASEPEPEEETPPLKFHQHDTVYMSPSGERCIINDLNEDSYNLLCAERDSNVFHENIPEFYLIDSGVNNKK